MNQLCFCFKGADGCSRFKEDSPPFCCFLLFFLMSVSGHFHTHQEESGETAPSAVVIGHLQFVFDDTFFLFCLFFCLLFNSFFYCVCRSTWKMLFILLGVLLLHLVILILLIVSTAASVRLFIIIFSNGKIHNWITFRCGLSHASNG